MDCHSKFSAAYALSFDDPVVRRSAVLVIGGLYEERTWERVATQYFCQLD